MRIKNKIICHLQGVVEAYSSSQKPTINKKETSIYPAFLYEWFHYRTKEEKYLSIKVF